MTGIITHQGGKAFISEQANIIRERLGKDAQVFGKPVDPTDIDDMMVAAYFLAKVEDEQMPSVKKGKGR